jgi:hypothetical protein
MPANSLRERRYDPKQVRIDAVWDWITGAEALTAMQWLLTEVVRDTVPPHELAATVRSLLIRLSVLINASTLSHSVRSSFVETLFNRFSSPDDAGRAAALGETPEILDMLEQFSKDGDALSLVSKVVSIR